MAASYEARAHGVRGGMGGAQARRLCPDAIAVSPRFEAYVEASRAVFEVFRDTAPVVEGLSMEEAFLDVGGLERISGSPERIAARLRACVRERVGLAISVGVARTKPLAKLASGMAKPDGLLVVAPADELAFLRPLAIERVWGIGPATAKRLRAQGIETVGELIEVSPDALASIVGRAAGWRLHGLAHDREPAPVRSGRRRRSIGSQRALGRPARRSASELDSVLAGLVDRVTRRMRSKHRIGRTVVVRLRFGDFSRATRSRTLPRATASTEAVLAAARELLGAAGPEVRRRGLTLLGITISGLEDSRAGVQLMLPIDGPGSIRLAALDEALDEVRERFGAEALTRAALLGRSGLSARLLAGEKSGEPGEPG